MASTLPLTVLITLSQSAYCRPYHLLILSNNDTSIFIVDGQSPIFMLHNIYFLILFQTIQPYIKISPRQIECPHYNYVTRYAILYYYNAAF